MFRAIPAVWRLRKKKATSKSWMFSILRKHLVQTSCVSHVSPFQMAGKRISSRFLPEFSCDQCERSPFPVKRPAWIRTRFRQAISRLPIDSREIILLREFEDMSYQQIAGVLKCPVGTVMSRLGRARSKLHALLSSSPEGDSSGKHFLSTLGAPARSAGHKPGLESITIRHALMAHENRSPAPKPAAPGDQGVCQSMVCSR